MSSKINWPERYRGYLRMLGKVLSGETYSEYTRGTPDIEVGNITIVVRTMAAIDAALIKRNEGSLEARYFEDFKRQAKEYLHQMDDAE
jgi:hypothetical protein